jgi:exonuclease SbcD
VGADLFPAAIDYLALGHLHVPQAVGGAAHMRYSGSPIPMGYGEATQDKTVVLVGFEGAVPDIREIPVPRFQQLVRVAGSLDEIRATVERLKGEASRAWLEIDYTGREVFGNLREIMDDALAGSAMEIRRIKNRRVIERVIGAVAEDETLDDLDPGDVFARCLDAFDVPDEDRDELTASYDEIIRSIHEEDANAE